MVQLFLPGKEFPAVSVTGNRCNLDCLHCKGHFLRGMIPVEKPSRLWRFAQALERNGGRGLLVSGGCDAKGRVPLRGFSDVLKKIKHQTNLLINVHPGFVGKEEVDALSRAQIDAVSVDVVGSRETLRDVYHLDSTIGDVEASLRLLRGASLPLTPHICVGLHGGRIIGEHEALRMVCESDPAALVITALLPVVGTPFEAAVVEGRQIVDFYTESRKALPNVPIVLGCMRPRTENWLDQALIREGIDGIAVPLPSTLRSSSCENIKRACCALIGSENL